MTLREIIDMHSKERLKHAQMPSELRRAIMRSEHRQKFLDGMQSQIVGLPERIRLDQQKLKVIIEAFTDLFVLGLQRLHDQRNMSDIKKSQLLAEEQKQKDLEATASGTPTGDYAEILEPSDGPSSDTNR